jgi:hypothetical protein
VFRLDEDLKVYLHRAPVDFRLSINGLAALVQHALGLDPFAACVYVFSNRRANQTTFSIPILVRGDRVPMAPAARQEGSAVPTGWQEGPSSRPRRGRGWLVEGTAGVDV